MSAKCRVKTTSRGTETQTPCWTGTCCNPSRSPATCQPVGGPTCRRPSETQASPTLGSSSLLRLPKSLYFSALRGKSSKRRDMPSTPPVEVNWRSMWVAATGTQTALPVNNHLESACTKACFYFSAVPAQNSPKTNSVWLMGFEFAPLLHHTVMDIINDTFLLF